MSNKGKEQKLEFSKWCLGGAGTILGFVMILSFIQELIKRKLRARKLKRNERPAICTSSVHFKTEADAKANEVNMRNSIVLKKFECDFDIDDLTEEATFRGASDSTLDIMSSRTLESPRDLESFQDLESPREQLQQQQEPEATANSSTREGSVTESSSEEEQAQQMNTSRRSLASRRLSNIFRTSMSNLTEVLSDPPPIVRKSSSSSSTSSSKQQQPKKCRLCNMPFQNGDDVCSSSHPRCNHMFHQHCITKWLTYQNSCPVCSEPFVILTSEQKR